MGIIFKKADIDDIDILTVKRIEVLRVANNIGSQTDLSYMYSNIYEYYKKAYIIIMYTSNDYRRKGIASKVLNLLIDEAFKRGVTFITLETTQMGRYLYSKNGFVNMNNEMILLRNKE